MAEGMLKSAPEIITTSAPQHPVTENIPIMINDVPVVLADYFDLDFRNMSTRDMQQLRDIMELTGPHKSKYSILKAVQDLEIQLGYANGKDTRHGKIWSHLKVGRHIKELSKDKR